MEKNFFQACSEGDLAQVKLFLSINQEKINEKNANGWTGLIMACYNQHVETAKFLVSQGADVNATNGKGTNVFMYAKTWVQKNPTQTELLEYLLTEGADINHLDQFKKSVLDYVKENKARQLEKWLVDKGAKSGTEITTL